jgi:eukaryotic-like serine/threonine-protein kinase
MWRPGFPRRFGRHLLLKELGHGRLGRVFLAHAGGRLCAIKMLAADDGGGALLGSDDNDVRRFVDEARLATRLDHPNLLYVAEAHPTGRPPFLVAEYVRGKSLRHLLHRCADWRLPFPLGLALYVTREVLRGLGYLHELEDQDLVHRDVTPSSILCSYEGQVKLADFGLARWRDRLAQTMVGERWIPSPYQSPEQRRGLPLDPRSDLFAVGLILWELLTGRRAVEPGSTMVGASMLAMPSRVVPQLPSDIDDLVMTALAEDPNDRYPSAGAFAARVTALLTASQDGSRLKAFLEEMFEVERERETDEEQALVSAAERMLAEEVPPAPAPQAAPTPAAPLPPGSPPHAPPPGSPPPAPPPVSLSAASSSARRRLPTPISGVSLVEGALARELSPPDQRVLSRKRRAAGWLLGLAAGAAVTAVLYGPRTLRVWRERGQPPAAAPSSPSAAAPPPAAPTTPARGSPAGTGAPPAAGTPPAATEPAAVSPAVPAAAPPSAPTRPPAASKAGPRFAKSLRPVPRPQLAAVTSEARRAGARFLARGEAMLRQRRLPEALSYAEAARAAGLTVRSRLLRGRVYLASQRFPEARAEFEAVLKVLPGSRVARDGLAQAEQRQAAPAARP